MVTEADASAICTAYEQDGEFAAAMELRRLFPGIVDNERAIICARAIAGWQPLPSLPERPRRGRPIKPKASADVGTDRLGD